MSSLVGFDQQGAFGPAITLMFNAQYFNAKGVADVAELLRRNFKKLTQKELEGKKEFCALVLQKNKMNSSITSAEIIHSVFFQNMQQSKHSPAYHEKVLNLIVPRMLKTVQEYIPQADIENPELSEWTARFVGSYITESQVQKFCDSQGAATERIQDERDESGTSVRVKITPHGQTSHLFLDKRV